MQDLQNVCPHGVAAIICVFSCLVCLSAFEEQNANMWHYDPVDAEHTGHCPPRQRRAPRNEAYEGQHESAYVRTLPSRESRRGTWSTASLSAQASTHGMLQYP